MKTANKPYPKSVQKQIKQKQTNFEMKNKGKLNQKVSNKFINQKNEDWPNWKLAPYASNSVKQSTNKEMKQKHLKQLAQTKNKTVSSTTTDKTRGSSQKQKINKNLINSPYISKKLQNVSINTKVAKKVEQKQQLFQNCDTIPYPQYISRARDTIYYEYFCDKDNKKVYFFPLKDSDNKIQYCQHPLKQLPPFSDIQFYQKYRNKFSPIFIMKNESIVKQLQKYKKQRSSYCKDLSQKQDKVFQFYSKMAKYLQFNLD